MLARVNRLVRGDDYRRVVRRGRKIGASHVVGYFVERGDDGPARIGFIVAKTVGNAVIRNRVRRRLKAASYGLLGVIPPGVDLVIRALPASAGASWVTLQGEISRVVDRGEAKR